MKGRGLSESVGQCVAALLQGGKGGGNAVNFIHEDCFKMYFVACMV